jgi:hypothetical protein
LPSLPTKASAKAAVATAAVIAATMTDTATATATALTLAVTMLSKNMKILKLWQSICNSRIGFSVDLDLHEKMVRRIGSRRCKNHVESDLYFCFRSFFFFFRSE